MFLRRLVFTSAVCSMLACGTPAASLDVGSSQAAPLIGGTEASEGAFPNVGALIRITAEKDGPGSVGICTGTLIGVDRVLTAAHCQPPAGDESVTLFSRQTSVLNSLDGLTTDTFVAPADAIMVEEWYGHADYDSVGSELPGGLIIGQHNDIALALLAHPVANVEPAVLFDGDLPAGAELTLVGYGYHRPIAIDVGAVGVKMWGTSISHDIGDYEFGVGKQLALPRVCHGDSGGPAFIDTPQGPRVVGVANRLAPQYKGRILYTCSGDAIYARVSAYLDWMAEAP